MTPHSRSLEFSADPLALSAGAGFILFIAVLALAAWRRSGWRAAVGWLEALRVLVAAAIALTLLQPEWRETWTPDRLPVVAVLADVSGSMETRDHLDPARPEEPPRARAEVAAALSRPEAWSALEGRFEVRMESFSSGEELGAEASDLNGALGSALERHPRLAAVVLASDGDWNAGGPPSVAATRLRAQGVPVFAVPAGSAEALPDLEITSFDVPVFAVAGKPLRIPFAVSSTFPREVAAVAELRFPGGEVISREITVPAMGRTEDSLAWRPAQTGEASLVLEILPQPGETVLENNRAEASLEIREERLRVLVVESWPRWEYRYLRNALERDPGVEVDCLLYQDPALGRPASGRGYLESFPAEAELSGYDVVFLGDVGTGGGQLQESDAEALRRLVRDQAGGLVFLPGMRGLQASLVDTPLGELMPVVWDLSRPRGQGSAQPGKFALTEAGRSSLLTKLEDNDEASAATWSLLPGFHWHAPALRAKAGTEVLAIHATESTPYGRVPLIVTRPYGAGKVVFMGADGAWRWRRGVEDRYHYRFWGQVARWMAYQRGMAAGERMRLFHSPDRPRVGESLALHANVASPSGEPLREGAVVVQIAAPGGRVSSLRLAPAGEEAWGLFTGWHVPAEPGPHQILLSSAESGSPPLEAVISVQGAVREKRGRPARLDVLEEIARLTRGDLISGADPAEAVAAVAALPDPDPEQRRFPLWSHPAWAGAILLLLGVFWAGRKAAGMF